MLEQHVLAGYTEFGGAVLHVGSHVGGAHHDDPQIWHRGADDQAPRRVRIFRRYDARPAQQRGGLLQNATLGRTDYPQIPALLGIKKVGTAAEIVR